MVPHRQPKQDAASPFITLGKAFQFLFNLLKGLLAIPHFLIETILCQQILMRTALGNLPLIQNNNFIRRDDC
jgi:hypothetical protein